MMKLNTLLGSYLPGFFRLKLETHEDIPSINEMNEEVFDIFLHEYCHYLQDVTTSAGLFNLYCISEYLHSVINRIYKSSSPQFEIPFDLTGDSDNVIENFEILKLTNGHSTNPINYADAQSFTVDHISISQESTSHISAISQVSLIASSGQSRIFGAMTIKESMAYLMEELCGKQIKSPDYPYDAARQIAALYSPGFASDPLSLITLCDMSLMCSNPASSFLHFMSQIQTGTLVINKPEDIVDYFYSERYQTYDGKEITFLDSFTKILESTRKVVKEYLREISTGNSERNLSDPFNHEVARPFRAYFDTLFSNVLTLRSQDRYFLIRLCRGGYALNNPEFLSLVTKIGFPLLENLDGQIFEYPSPIGDSSTLQYLSAVGEIFKTLSQGQRNCGMESWCILSQKIKRFSPNLPPPTVSLRCKSSPWKKANERALCPYALLWRHWQLTPYTPVDTGDID